MLIYIYSAFAHVCLQVQLGSLINSTVSFAGCFFTTKKISNSSRRFYYSETHHFEETVKKITKNAWSQVKSVWLPGTSLKGNESQKQQLHQSVYFSRHLFSLFSFLFPSFKLCSWTHLLQVSRRSINFSFWSVSHWVLFSFIYLELNSKRWHLGITEFKNQNEVSDEIWKAFVATTLREFWNLIGAS